MAMHNKCVKEGNKIYTNVTGSIWITMGEKAFVLTISHQ